MSFPQKINAYHIMWMLIALQVTVFALIVLHPGTEAGAWDTTNCVEELGRLYCNNPIDLTK